MHPSTLTFAVLPLAVLAWDSSSSPTTSPAPTDTCVTITQTNAPPCTTPSPCTVEECLQLSTITQSCGCASIYSTDICLSTCPLKCQTSYVTMYLPCATSISSPTSPITPTSPTSPTSSSSPTGGSSSLPTTSVIYRNTTTTVTSISTLTTCPASCTCSGQTTIWSGTNGPSSCTKTPSCSVVLPGGGTTTVTGVTLKTGPTPTTSASSTGPSNLQSSDGRKRREAGGLLAGLLGVLAFL